MATGMSRRARWAGAIALAALVAGSLGCADSGATAAEPVVEVREDGTKVRYEKVKIRETTYKLEVADDPAKRLKGLSGRAAIPKTGGMIFVFKRPALQQFVMRDCLVDIDIIFVDRAGRITDLHAMKVEPPQGEDETDAQYERRLKRYSSRFPAQVVIELKGGTLAKLDPPLKRGDKLEVDVRRLGLTAK